MVYISSDEKKPKQLCFDWAQAESTAARFNHRFLSKLLFLLKPPQPIGERIFADTGRHAEGRTDRQAYPADLLHITLFCVGCFRTLPDTLIGKIQKAMDRVRAQPVPVTLDRSEIFGNRTSLVLKSSRDTFEINGLAKVVQRQLLRQNIPFAPVQSFVPHVTTIYGCGKIDLMPVDQPYCWTADNFELVFSHNGETRHEALGHWELCAQAKDYGRPAGQLCLRV